MERKKVLIATGNPGKLREFSRMLHPLGFAVVSPGETGVSGLAVVEDGLSFAENAYKKAYAYQRAAGLPALADDSGLVVDALDGEPGIYSARYGGEGLTDEQRTALLLRNLEGVPEEKRTARFVCAICFLGGNGERLEVSGVCEGKIGFAPQGENGFGYDPVFLVEGGSFSQLHPDKKDEVSHRGKALRALCEALKNGFERSQGDADQ